MLTNHKNFLTASTTASADETACTRQPRLRPGCRLYAVSSLDIVVARGPLTPLATYSCLSQTPLHYPSDQDGFTPGTVILRDCNPGLCCKCLIAHEPVMGSLCECEHKWEREHDCKQERECNCEWERKCDREWERERDCKWEQERNHEWERKRNHEWE